MSDVFELVVALNLRDDLSDAEVADLRWHLGLGPQPERLTILTEFPVVVVDDRGEPRVVNEPRQVLAQRGAARHSMVGGALVSALVRRENPAGWAMTSRQELHPDGFDEARALLGWLARHADYGYVGLDGSVQPGGCGNVVGYLRFHEDVTPTPLTVKDATIAWPYE